MIYIKMIIYGIMFLSSALFWANACASLVRTYDKEVNEKSFISKKWVIITGGFSYVILLFISIVVIIYQETKDTSPPKFELIQEPVYKKVMKN